MADIEQVGKDLYGASEGDSAGPGQDFSDGPPAGPDGDPPVDESITGGGADGSGQITGETPPEGPPPNAIGPTGDNQLDTDITEATAPGDITTPDITLTPETILKDLTSGPKKVIKNPSLYDTSLLNSPDDLKKYLSDPIAFMSNYVWNYDISSNQMVFRYAMPSNIIFEINKTTKEFIGQTRKELKALEKNYNSLPIKNRNLVIDNLFRQIFSKKVADFVQAKYPNRDFSFLKQEYKVTDPKFNAFKNENIKFFWFWLNQICAANIGTKEGGIYILFNDQSAEPLNLVFYYLVEYYISSLPTPSETKSNLIPENLSILDVLSDTRSLVRTDSGQVEEFVKPYAYYSLIITNALPGKIFTNTNNYVFNSTDQSIVNDPVINFQGSPFFSVGTQNLTEKQKGQLVIPKIVKECKDIDPSKDETSLKLFYKEGNDNILDKKIPQGNLGCSTKVKKWEQAQSIIFNIDSVVSSKPRKNLSLPYYNRVNVKNKSVVPVELNIYEVFRKDVAKKDVNQLPGFFSVQKEFATLLTLESINKELTDVLIDKSLIDGKDFKISNLIFSNYENGSGLWGPEDFYKLSTDKNVELDLKGFSHLTPFNGIYEISSLVNKKKQNNSLVQSFFVNKYKTSQASNNGPYTIYDSQVKYGTPYLYELFDILNFVEIDYDYETVILETNDIKSNDFTGQRIDVNFVAEKRFRNVIDSLEQGKTELATSYVDLPPLPTLMEIYPFKGINDKLGFAFQKLSQSKKIVEKSIPKKLWTEGWEIAKKYYTQVLKITNFVPEDRVYFSGQNIRKINIYFKKGEKPKSLLDLNEKFGELDIVVDSFSKSFEIEPNVKYYFASKSESFTGLESYFSDVYEVEVVDDGGTVFPIVKVVSLEQKRERPHQISFSNQFRIQPAMLQQAPNIEKDTIGFLSPTVFSEPDETRPRFKVRLTSKKTGRKVDFNVIYKRKINLGAKDIADISVDSAKKENILISYKSKFVEKAVETAQASLDSDSSLINIAAEVLQDPDIADVLQGVSSDKKLIEAAISAGFVSGGAVSNVSNYFQGKTKQEQELLETTLEQLPVSVVDDTTANVLVEGAKKIKEQRDGLDAAVSSITSGDVSLLPSGATGALTSLTNPCCKSVLNVPDGVGGFTGETQKTEFVKLDQIFEIANQKPLNKQALFTAIETILPKQLKIPTGPAASEGVPQLEALQNSQTLCYLCKRIEYKSTGKSLFAILEEKLSGNDLKKLINLIDCTRFGWQQKRGSVKENKFYWTNAPVKIFGASVMSLVVTGKCPVPTKLEFSQGSANVDTTPGFTPNFGE